MIAVLEISFQLIELPLAAQKQLRVSMVSKAAFGAKQSLQLRKLKPKRENNTRPLPTLATRPSRSGRGLIVGAGVAFLTGQRRRISNRL